MSQVCPSLKWLEPCLCPDAVGIEGGNLFISAEGQLKAAPKSAIAQGGMHKAHTLSYDVPDCNREWHL